MRIRALAIFAAILLAGTACQPKHDDRHDSKLVDAYKLIDANRDDEAIYLLEQEMTRQLREPYLSEVKTALASAYAHKAGFRVQRLTAFLEVSKNRLEFNFQPRNTGHMSKSEAADAMIRSVVGLAQAFHLFLDYYTSIPTIKNEDEVYLDHALRILDSIDDKQLTQSEALYRAVIRVIFLKNYLAGHLFDDGAQINLDIERCEIDLHKVAGSFRDLADMTAHVMDDLAHAQPSKSKNYETVRNQIVKSVSDLTVIMSSASLIDDTSALVAKNAIIEAGLRSLLKCYAEEKPSSTSQPSPP